MSKVKAVAATIVFMLGASVSYAQGPPLTFPQNNQTGQSDGIANQFYQTAPPPTGWSAQTLPNEPGPMYVACRAEVPSHNTAYFSATFPSPTVNSARKEFRELVTAQYGEVSRVQCAGKFSETVVNEKVEKWKDSARTTKNAIVDTDWQPVASDRQLPPKRSACGDFEQCRSGSSSGP